MDCVCNYFCNGHITSLSLEYVRGSQNRAPGVANGTWPWSSPAWLSKTAPIIIPRCAMYGIFTYIYPQNSSNVGKDSLHGAYGIWLVVWNRGIL